MNEHRDIWPTGMRDSKVDSDRPGPGAPPRGWSSVDNPGDRETVEIPRTTARRGPTGIHFGGYREPYLNDYETRGQSPGQPIEKALTEPWSHTDWLMLVLALTLVVLAVAVAFTGFQVGHLIAVITGTG